MPCGALRSEAIYLFGSHAYGTPHPHSDLDLLVVVNDAAGDLHDLAVRGGAALRGLRIPKDILVCYQSDMERWAPVSVFAAEHGGKQRKVVVCRLNSNWFDS